MKQEISFYIDNFLIHCQIVDSKEEAKKREQEFIKSASEIHPLTAKIGKGFHAKINEINKDHIIISAKERREIAENENIEGQEEYDMLLMDLVKMYEEDFLKNEITALTFKSFRADKLKEEWWNKFVLKEHYISKSPFQRDKIKSFFEQVHIRAKKRLNLLTI